MHTSVDLSHRSRCGTYKYRVLRIQILSAFPEAFSAKNNVKFIKAGVGGTPSELGMIRFDRDVLRDGQQPDIVVIEFAVNDEGMRQRVTAMKALYVKYLICHGNRQSYCFFRICK